jgi:hypothetical protein
MANALIKRTMIDEINLFLQTEDIIVIHGARQVGKTSIMFYFKEQLEQSGERTFYIDLEDSRYTTILDRGVNEFLTLLAEEGFNLGEFTQNGKKLYVLIDEIQYLSNPSSFLKLLADHHHNLKMIVSGSSSFEMKSKFKDSLVGRTVNFEIYPLSFKEFLLFKGIPLIDLPHYTDKKISELQSLFREFALFGGYPKIVMASEIKIKETYLQQIIDTYIRKDIRDLAEIKDVVKFNRLVEILAAQSGNLLNIAEVSNTCDLSRPTVERYIFLLEQTYIIRLVRPFSRNLRSELSKTPKVFFYDTGLMQMLWLKRLQKEVLGPVFETSIFSELVKRYQRNQIFYWRTLDKKEIDFVVALADTYMPIETKLSFPRIIPAAITSFMTEYNQGKESTFKIIGLEGQASNQNMIYPWQL